MKNARLSICAMSVVLFITVGQGFGYIEFNDGDTHNINYVINESVLVDNQSPNTQTTVNLIPRGYISSTLQGYNNSNINMDGGYVDYLYAFDSSHITVSSGTLGHLEAYGNSESEIYGSLAHLNAYGNSQITMLSGTMLYLHVYDNSHFSMSGGVLPYGQFQGDQVSGVLWAYGSSQITISGGSIYGLRADGSSTITMSGGTIGGNIMLNNGALLTLNGSNFTIDGISIGFGEIVKKGGFRTLTGILANGDRIHTTFQTADSAKVILIPEPCTIALLGLGGLLLRRRKK
jgi:hypothetical protein